ncbi:uncharacterized protein LOC121875828 isoform X1 [Homarus americanus]|uniref:uncharacterized protein LOC121875828 isoform X1 n=1 Tax=Homarus americanus TaxID=6706 RepID=UPI001C483084|nr:uncharacterized protein LOC121875828 isoform X1 [Homarus americanus]XP_042236457.1 uncharacterized protein LOC121875828 isoform X1 [Homarus americanus]
MPSTCQQCVIKDLTDHPSGQRADHIHFIRQIEAMCEVTIREGRRCDSEAMLQLIQKSAKHQNLPPDAVISASAFEEDGWGSFTAFRSFVAEMKDGSIVGYVLYYYTYSTWKGRCVCMGDLYVFPTHRHKGIGSRLWKKVAKTALDAGCCHLNITLLKDNAQAVAYCESQGAMNISAAVDWCFFRMNRDAMEAFLKTDKTASEVVVREATGKDCVGIKKLIQDLADYENMPEGPKIGAKELQEDSSGEILFYKAYVAEEVDTLVGYVLFFYTYSLEGPGVYMEDLYVSPPYRNQGIGSALWRKAIQASIDVGGKRCDFAVLSWNTPSIEFYKLKGAANLTKEKGYQFYRMKEDEMKNYANE